MNPRMLRACMIVLVKLQFIGLALITFAGCDPGEGITYDNRTPHTITIFWDESSISGGTVPPGETKTYTMLEFDHRSTFTAKDENGRVVHTETITWEELKERGWKVIIVESKR